MTQLAHNWIGYTEAQQKAKALGATVEGVFWVRPPDKAWKERFSVHYFRPDGLEIAYWHYGTGIFTEIAPREWNQDWYDQLEKETLE